MKLPLALPVLLGTLCVSTAAQSYLPHTAGFSNTVFDFDASLVTGDTRMWGAEYLNGELFITGDGLSGSNTAPHDVYVFNLAGTRIRTFTQSPHTDLSRLGWFDLATDGTSLIGCSELGIHVFDTNGALVNTVQAANGPQTITQPITGAAIGALTQFAGIAYNPDGNGGNGSFWVGDSDQALIELDLQGNVLTQHPNTPGWYVRGLVRDHITGNLWVASLPHRSKVAEIDVATGLATGRTLISFRESFPGGLGAVRDGAYGSAFDILVFEQTDDTLAVNRVHLHPNILGYEEPTLLNEAVGSGNFPTSPDRATEFFQAGDLFALTLDTTSRPQLNGGIAWLIYNLDTDARKRATTNAFFLPGNPVFPEVRGVNPISVPASDPNLLIIEPMVIGQPALVSVPNPFSLPNGYKVRVQALYIDPAAPTGGLMASNDVFFEGYSSNIIVEAKGPSAYNGATGEGFFQITHLNGLSITEVKLDFSTSSNPLHATTEFDTNQSSIGIRFDGGSGAPIPGTCAGTFRNNSDILTGLIFDGTNTVGGCDPSIDTGWRGSIAGGTSGDFRDLTFRFAPGQFARQRFEFDCDIDEGPGEAGGDMAGLVVTITLSDGSMLSGELVADPLDPQRSSIAF